jgi:hypothetical protein
MSVLGCVFNEIACSRMNEKIRFSSSFLLFLNNIFLILNHFENFLFRHYYII